MDAKASQIMSRCRNWRCARFKKVTRPAIAPLLDNQRFIPGPDDHLIPANGAGEFSVTPDNNAIVEVGIKSGSSFAMPLWQREGTTNPFQQ
jgi:hypothetical protein